MKGLSRDHSRPKRFKPEVFHTLLAHLYFCCLYENLHRLVLLFLFFVLFGC